jgi:ATP-dependent Lhr-like helicase
MPDLAAQLALKARLSRTWPAFFERHGRFTAAQLAALPIGLNGANMMLCAPTASGKTEAALAPLVERLPDIPRGLVILYLTPTRALVSDLAERLARPMERLHLSLAVKTHDLITFNPKRPANVLITTPESLDSLFASHARALINVRGVVIDELHLFDGTPRGDQLRVLLNRLRILRTYAAAHEDSIDAAIQYVALSATLPNPQMAAARYFDQAHIVTVTGARPIDAELIALDADTPTALRDYLATFQTRGWRKALVFCNTRAEVEYYAAVVGKRTLFGDAVYVHYSNIAPERRREIEQSFAQAPAALCFASSTLELGIDIGSIDVVALIGPPGNSGSFLQRLGRGNRRRNRIQAALFYRSELERDLFEALLDDSTNPVADDLDEGLFRPSVAIQQLFSLLKQSPTGALRLPELIALLRPMLGHEAVQTILGKLQASDYLTAGRPGEWRAGERLQRLIDQQASTFVSLSLYSNIQTTTGMQFDIVDQHSGQRLARTDSTWLNQSTLLLEGRQVDIRWFDGEAIWVSSTVDAGTEKSRPESYTSTRQLLGFELAQRLGARYEQRAWPRLIETDTGWLCFHFLGDLYGRTLNDLLLGYVKVESTDQPGISMLFAEYPSNLPTFTEAHIVKYLEKRVLPLESTLALGAFEHLLPFALRQDTVIKHFRVGRFLRAYAALKAIVCGDL